MKILAALIYAYLSLSLTKANDTTATVAAGAIRYSKSSDISMDSEILKVSTEQINVEYQFTNHSTQEITSTVVFPLPPSPLTFGDTGLVYPGWDDLLHASSFTEQMTKFAKSPQDWQPHYGSLKDKIRHAAFTDFKRTVDGQEYGYNCLTRAIHKDGRDITSLLIEHDIPLSATFVRGFAGETDFIEERPKLQQKLQKLGLINRENVVLWQLHINYVWSQVFPAQKTIHVTHSYRPHPGDFWWSASKDVENFEFNHRDEIKPNQFEIKELKNYCPTQANMADIKAMCALNETNNLAPNYRAKEVRYILSTGNNWKGPIKKFRLEIVPPLPSTIVMTCFPTPLHKNEQGIYVVELENFMPQSDLKILFMDAGFK